MLVMQTIQQAREWRRKNREKVRAWKRAYRARHPETSRLQHRKDLVRTRVLTQAWRIEHPEQARIHRARRRARIASVLATLTAAEWEAILEAAGHACIYCGTATNLTMDHLTPLARGGNHTAENVAPACGPCNSSKGAKVVADFLAER
jgi:5-methylcytosine-specific restriction endonuclease McrA